MLTRFSVIVLALAVSLQTKSYGAEQHEVGGAPPLECQYERGAWCVFGGVPKIEESRDKTQTIWQFDSPDPEVSSGFIIEPSSCRNVKSDIVQIIERRSDFEFRGTLWKTSVVRLEASGNCDLRLVVPRGPKRGSRAERYVPGKIGVCAENVDCAQNPLIGITRDIF